MPVRSNALATLTNSFDVIQLFIRHSLMNPNSVVVQHAGAGAHGAKSKLARTFADFEFYTWMQSVTYAQSLWEQHAAMPIHLKSHVSSVSSDPSG